LLTVVTLEIKNGTSQAARKTEQKNSALENKTGTPSHPEVKRTGHGFRARGLQKKNLENERILAAKTENKPARQIDQLLKISDLENNEHHI
jgi:hypothetical protein